MADFYTAASDPANDSDLDSSVIRAEWTALALGFTKVAGYTGAGNRVVHINTGATAQTTTTGFTFDGTTLVAPALTVTNNAAVNGTALTTSSATFTALAGATTLLTIGGTGASAVVATPGTLDATSPTAAALKTAGGLGVAKALWVGGLANVAGAVTLQSTLAYGGVTLTAAVTGTGKMVLDGTPTLVTPVATTSLTTGSTTFALINDTATTLNIGGAATTLAMGAGAASTLNANFTTAINLNTAAIVSNQTTVAVINTNATTVNAFGAASIALNIGHASAAATFPGGISIPTGKTLSGAGAINISGAITGGAISGTTGNFSGLITATTAGISVPTSALGTAYSSTYTPTITNGTNVAASAAFVTSYARVGNYVHVSGMVNIDPTTASATDWEITLPVASTFANVEELGGTAGTTNAGGHVWANPATGKAQFFITPVSTANQTMGFTFGYRVI